MSIPDVGWAFAFALVIAILLAAFGFWYGGKTEKKNLLKKEKILTMRKKELKSRKEKTKKSKWS